MMQIKEAKCGVFDLICYGVIEYCVNRHRDRQTDTHTHTEEPTAKNVILGFRGPQNV